MIDQSVILEIEKLKGIERLMHFKYEYSIEGHLVSKYLYGNNNDSINKSAFALWQAFFISSDVASSFAQRIFSAMLMLKRILS